MNQEYHSHNAFPYDRETLESYLKGLLDKDRTGEIQTAIENSEELATQVEGLKFLLELEGQEGVDRFMEGTLQKHKATIEAYVPEKSPADSSTYPKSRPILSYLLAAALAMLIGIGAFFINQNDRPEQLINREIGGHFALVQAQVRQGGLDENSWEYAYMNKNYAQVIANLSKAPEMRESEHFYLGMSYLYEQKYPSAIDEYQAVIAYENPNGYQQQARWFKALGHIKVGQEEEAKTLWEAISQNPRHFKKEEAGYLLNNYF